MEVASFGSRKLCGPTIPAFHISIPCHSCKQQRKGHIHLDCLVPIHALPDALARDLRRVDEVLEDLVVHLLERPRPRARLLGTAVAAGLADHAALSDEDDVPVGEFLLQLAGEAAAGTKYWRRRERARMS